MSNDECTAAQWGRVWDPGFSDKKCKDLCPRDKPNEKKSMSTTAQTYWPSSAEIWEGQRNYSLKNEVDKDAISCFSIRKDWRFAVRAKSFALHWRSRGFSQGHVRSCEKGLWIAARVHKNKMFLCTLDCSVHVRRKSGPRVVHVELYTQQSCTHASNARMPGRTMDPAQRHTEGLPRLGPVEREGGNGHSTKALTLDRRNSSLRAAKRMRHSSSILPILKKGFHSSSILPTSKTQTLDP